MTDFGTITQVGDTYYYGSDTHAHIPAFNVLFSYYFTDILRVRLSMINVCDD